MTDTQEILVNKKAYLELKASHERLKAAMPNLIRLASLAYIPLSKDKTILETIKEAEKITETAEQALKQAK